MNVKSKLEQISKDPRFARFAAMSPEEIEAEFERRRRKFADQPGKLQHLEMQVAKARKLRAALEK